MNSVARVGLLVGLAALGAASGVIGAFVHDISVGFLGLDLPVGLLLALLPVAGVYFLAGWLLRTRLAVLAPGAAWLVPVLVFAVPKSEGDLVIAASLAGYAFLLGGSTLIGLGVAVPFGNLRPPIGPVP